MPRTTSKSKSKSKSTPTKRRRAERSISHLHVVIDDQLRDGLTAHAVKLDGSTSNPNLSAAVRDLLRGALGLPRSLEDLTAA